MKRLKLRLAQIASLYFTSIAKRASLFFIILFAVFACLSAPAADLQTIHHRIPPAALNQNPVSRSARWDRLSLTIGLPLRNREDLTNFLEQVSDPSSPNFRHYLTPEQFAERFAPTEEDYQSVIKFAESHGLSVAGKHSNRTLLDVKGTVMDVERAFHVNLNVYNHPTEARKFFAPDVEPSIDLATPVLAISGLDNYLLPHSCLRPTPEAPAGQPKPQISGSGPGGYFMGSDFRHAYAPGTTLTGAGQTVALLEFDGYYPGDVAAYKKLAGLPDVPVTTVLLDGVSGAPGPGTGNQEVALDIDMAIAMAPGISQILVYEGNSANDILNRIATDRRSSQISASWTYTINATTLQIYQQFVAQGQSFFNSSGDDGSYGSSVAPPTDVPYITIVGGTELNTANGGGAWTSETGWSFSGGGISPTYSIPSYQQGVNMKLNNGSSTFRNLPDVALVADNCWLIAENGSGFPVSGTSISAPLWAGFMALVNQLAVSHGEPAAGFINPVIYSIGKGSNSLSYGTVFHDITSGNNESSANPTRFNALAGYDLVTGWGTPRGSNLITILALPEPLRIAPDANVFISGPVGGPFTPSPLTFTLTNNTPGTIHWSLANNSQVLDISPTSGTLTFGGPATAVTATTLAADTNLATGAYPTVLSFTNLDDKFGQTRLVTLAVVTPPVITAQPTNESLLVGQNANFTVGTTSNALQNFQWRKNGVNLNDGGQISGSLTASLTISNLTTANAGTYSVTVSNVAGFVLSSNAQLTIAASAPVVSVQPTNQSALPGTSVSFSVAAVGNAPFSYQWRLNGTNLVNGGNYSGVTTSTLSVSNISSLNGGAYSVKVNNSVGSVISADAILTVIPVSIPGLNISTLFSLPGGNSGLNMYSPLIQAKDGNFYGTAIQGGVFDAGTIFKLSPAGSFSTVLSFNGTNGAIPYAGLLQGKDGSLYGTTYNGGTFADGNVFRVSTAGIIVNLANFNVANGSFPVAGLMQAADGNLYGTTSAGGAFGGGTVFRVSVTGTFTTLASFNDTDGSFPSGVLIQATDGNLYGTTEDGGTNGGYGTIFKISPSGVLTSLYSFSDGSDGGLPVPGLVQASDGNLYGVAIQGGDLGYGTIFKISPSGAFTAFYSFTNGLDGSSPWGGLMEAADGNLYGTTQSGGTYGYGTVFRLAPGGSVTPVAQFDNYNGSTPSAALIQASSGDLYGTTLLGGPNDDGAIYKLSISGPVQITGQPVDQTAYIGGAASFSVATFGKSPISYQWQQDGVDLTDGGNISGSHTANLIITNVTADDSALYSVVVSNAFNSVASDDAVLEVIVAPPHITSHPHGATAVAGTTTGFTVTALGEMPLQYQWRFNGTNLTDGGNISGSSSSALTLTAVTLANAGTYSVIVSNTHRSVVSDDAALTVVPVTAPGAASATLRQLNGASDGAFPFSGLIQAKDGNLYGTANEGGSKSFGTIFKVNPANGSYSTVFAFPGVDDGAGPYAPLTQAKDGNFYGTTFEAGLYNGGTIFRMTPAGVVSFIYSFTGGSDGANPYSGLVQGLNGTFYGTTFNGGTDTYGTIYRMNVNATVNGLYQFSDGANATGDDGAYSVAGLTPGFGGQFYGTTAEGGTDGYGTVFGMGSNGLPTTIVSFSYTNGAFPECNMVQGPDGLLYGTTFGGGTNGFGTVFSLTTNGVLTTLYSFSDSDGSSPAAGLIWGSDGNLYGTTSDGGIGGQGTAFRITTNGALTTLLWFDGVNGANPEAPLVQAADGNFYGTTAFGGVGFNASAGGGYGLVFRLAVPVFITNQFSAAGAIASLPYSDDISARAISPAGDVLTFAKVSGPDWLNVAADGALSGTPAGSDIGINIFVVSLADTNGASATASLSVVVATNPPPAFLVNPFTATAANVGEVYSATIATDATDPVLALGDVLTFAKVSGPDWLTVASDGSLAGTPQSADAGSNTFVLSVTDLGGSTATAGMAIYVNSAPFFTAHDFVKPAATVGLPYSASIVTNASDADLVVGDTLSFYKVSGPAWLNAATNGALSGVPALGDIGLGDYLMLVVDSNGLAGVGSMEITVNADTAPAFSSSPINGPAGVPGQIYSSSIAGKVSDPDFGDTITLSKISGPDWLTISPTGDLNGTPANSDSGTNTFVVRATDFAGASTQATLIINVSGPITLGISHLGSQIVLSWTGGVAPYHVQTTTNLDGISWADFGGPITSNSLVITPTNAAAYFRIHVQ